MYGFPSGIPAENLWMVLVISPKIPPIHLRIPHEISNSIFPYRAFSMDFAGVPFRIPSESLRAFPSQISLGIT